MRCLISVVFCLPLILLGVESAENGVDSAPNQVEQSGDTMENKLDSTKNAESNTAESNITDSTKSAESAPEIPPTKEESGFMIGAGVLLGGPIGSNDNIISSLNSSLGNSNSKPLYYGFEVLLGHKTLFGKSGFFGMRLYLDYNYRKMSNFTLTAHFVGLNIDTLFNIYQSNAFKFGLLLGVRSGIGGGLNMKKGDTEVDIDWTVDVNTGLRFVIYDHNAIELLVQPRFGLVFLQGKNSMYGILRYVYTF